jgi:hypothetical protein
MDTAGTLTVHRLRALRLVPLRLDQVLKGSGLVVYMTSG